MKSDSRKQTSQHSKRRTSSQNLKQRKWLAAVLLAAITVAAYWELADHPFINYDDDVYVTNNPEVQSGLTGQSIKWAFQSTAESNWHPLTWISHMADCELYGLNPTGHHVTNFLLHIANVQLLFWTLFLMT